MNDVAGRAACANPAMHDMLGRYEFGAVSDDERAAFERHAVECDACFAELERGSVAVAHLRERSDRFAELLRPAPAAAPAPAEVAAAPRRWRPQLFGLRPQLAVAAALTLVAAGTGGWWLAGRRAADPARWASFPREAAARHIVRGPEPHDAVRELMETGASYFDLGRYADAERRFRAALERQPDLAEAEYFAGLSRALAGDPSGAVPNLERAVGLATGVLRPKAHWALANAYLASRRTAEAKRELEGLASEGGELGEPARDLLARLNR